VRLKKITFFPAMFYVLTVLSGCVAQPIQDPELQNIVQNASWAPISSAGDGAIWAVDQTSFRRSNGIVDVWDWTYKPLVGPNGVTTFQNTIGPAHPMRFDCAGRRYQQRVWALDKFVDVGWRPVSPGKIDSDMLSKLCGEDLPNGHRLEWLQSGGNSVFYYVPETTYVRSTSPRIIVIENIATFTPWTSGLPEVTVIQKPVFSSEEINCSTFSARQTAPHLFGEINPTSYKDWTAIGKGSELEPIARRFCQDSGLQVRVENPRPAEQLPQPIPKESEKINSMPIEAAKRTCSELGFMVGTEKFGTCVLQLTK